MKLFISSLNSASGQVQPIYGCTDPLALNYNPLATISDGSCIYDTGLPTIDLPTYNIVFDGNSWVSGSGSIGGLNFPNQLKTLLENNGKTVGLVNYGVAGQTILQMESDAVSQIDPLNTTYNVLIGLELVNQWGSNTEQTKEDIYAWYKQYFLDRIAAGFDYVIALTPISQTYYARSGWEESKLYFRTQMLSEFEDLGIYVADIGEDARLSDSTNLTYYTADLIHPTNAGYGVFAEIINQVII